jgi:hypothetical protein
MKYVTRPNPEIVVPHSTIHPFVVQRQRHAFLSQHYGGLDSVIWDDVKEGTVLYSEAGVIFVT